MAAEVIRGAVAPVGEAPTAVVVATVDQTSMEGAVITEEIALAIVTAVAEEVMEIRARPVMIATVILDRITVKGRTSGMILTRIPGIVVLLTGRGHVRSIHLRRRRVIEAVI